VEGAWNFGPGRDNEITVVDMVSRFMEAWGAEEAIQVAASPFPEAQTLRLEVSKAHAELGWLPSLSICQTIDMTAAWYRAYGAGVECAAEMARSQIASYKALTV
jgi:CDP-glucose 4,6-dehydratase